MPRTKNSNTIKKAGISNSAIREANRYLAIYDKRICKYTGELLDLNDKNFNKNGNDAAGFQQVSKLGMQLYHAHSREVKARDKAYVPNASKVQKLA